MMKRLLGPLLAIILVVGIGAAIFFAVSLQWSASQIVQVKGVIGSEKEAFFSDPRVIEALKAHQLAVNIEKAGSREIATRDLSQYDFAFPSGVPAAEKIRRDGPSGKSYDLFFTPMVIASWQPIAEILVTNNLAQAREDYYTLNVKNFLEKTLSTPPTTWNQLNEKEAYDVSKTMLILSTDVRSSNSAAMYLALSSYVQNGDQIVQPTGADEIADKVADLFLLQGFQAGSSQAPFESYLVMGMGGSPLVMIYEAQFIYQALPQNGGIRNNMVLMYPEPTIFTKHVLIGFTEAGQRLGEALETDETLQKLAIEHGFRNNNVAYFQEFIDKNGINIPLDLVSVIDPPTYEVMEAMITKISQKY